MPIPVPITDCSSPDDLALRIVESGAKGIGIVAASSIRRAMLDALATRLSESHRRVVRVPADLSAGGFLDFLERTLGDLLPAVPKTPELPTTPEGWRDRVIAELCDEQRAAQDRVAVAKQQGGVADPFDRDVAGWLAAGLCDLFADRITGESFLLSGKGAFARLAADAPNARFTEADFLRPEGIKFLEASRPAQSMLTKLSLASTGQFRAAASRLINVILDRMAIPKQVPFLERLANALHERGERLILSSENPSLAGAAGSMPVQWIVAGQDESSLRAALADDAVFFRYVEAPPPVVEVIPRPAILDDLRRLLDDVVAAIARIRLFQQHGLLPSDVAAASEVNHLKEEIESCLASGITANEDQYWSVLDRGQTELATIQQTVNEAWHRWFVEQLADIDAEWFLQQDPNWNFLDVTKYMAEVRDILVQTDASIKLPANEEEFAGAQKFISALKDLDCKWRTWLWTPVEEGMAFDAAVAAGGAPLSMLTQGVRWWLKKENRDWKNYRIVRVD